MSRARRASTTKLNRYYSTTTNISLLFFVSYFFLGDGSGYIEPRNSVSGLDPWDSTFWWYFYNVSNNNGSVNEQSSSASSPLTSSTSNLLISPTTILLATPSEESTTTNSSTTDDEDNLILTPTPAIQLKKAFIDKHKPKVMRMECHTFDDYQLYEMLAEHGAYNQRFMANTPEEIAHRMHRDFNLVKEDDDRDDDDSNNSNERQHTLNSAIRPKRSTQSELPCGWQCRKIKLILHRMVDDSLKTKKNIILAHNSNNSETDDEVNISKPIDFHNLEKSAHNLVSDMSSDDFLRTSSTTCNADHFIPIGDCETRGTEAITGYDRLCTECRGVYRMPTGCFPQFLNAVRCNDTDVSCIHDGWSNSAHGQCRAKSLTFTMMRNVGTTECQDWRFENIEIPIACECYLNKASWLKA